MRTTKAQEILDLKLELAMEKATSEAWCKKAVERGTKIDSVIAYVRAMMSPENDVHSYVICACVLDLLDAE